MCAITGKGCKIDIPHADHLAIGLMFEGKTSGGEEMCGEPGTPGVRASILGKQVAQIEVHIDVDLRAFQSS